MKRDLYNNVLTKLAYAPVAIAADATTEGIIIDTQGFYSGKVSLATGVVSAGDIVIEDIQQSDDAAMAGAVAIDADHLIGEVAVLDASNSVSQLGFIATKRYVRVRLTAANSAALLASATVELGHAEHASVQ